MRFEATVVKRFSRDWLLLRAKIYRKAVYRSYTLRRSDPDAKYKENISLRSSGMRRKQNLKITFLGLKVTQQS